LSLRVGQGKACKWKERDRSLIVLYEAQQRGLYTSILHVRQEEGQSENRKGRGMGSCSDNCKGHWCLKWKRNSIKVCDGRYIDNKSEKIGVTLMGEALGKMGKSWSWSIKMG
jgi:hypothetical protein